MPCTTGLLINLHCPHHWLYKEKRKVTQTLPSEFSPEFLYFACWQYSALGKADSSRPLYFLATWAWRYKQSTSSHCGSVAYDSWYVVASCTQWWIKNIIDNWILFTFGWFKSLITIGNLKDSQCHGTDFGPHITLNYTELVLKTCIP
jgi:hypothetical protein